MHLSTLNPLNQHLHFEHINTLDVELRSGVFKRSKPIALNTSSELDRSLLWTQEDAKMIVIHC